MKRLLAYLRPRWRKVTADLWESKTRTILVVASIAVGVFAVGAITSAYVIMSADIDKSYRDVSPANIEIWTDPFDENLVKSIENIPGVAAAEGRHQAAMRLSEDGEVWQGFDVVALDDFEAADVNRIQILDEGRTPNDREILVGFDTLMDPGFRVGDVAQIQLADGSTRKMPVVGLVRDQSKAGNFAALPSAYVSREALNWLGEYYDYNRLYVTVSGDPGDEAAIKQISQAVEDKIEKSGRNVYRVSLVETDKHPMKSTVLAMLGVLGALGVLVMLLSSSLIVNTLNALLSQHLRQIGVMKLVGARSPQISLMYILLIVIYGLIALLIAVPLGAAAGYGLSAFIADFMSADLQGFRIVPLAIVLQVAIAFFVPLAAGYFPINKGAKTTVRRAISNNGAGAQGGSSPFLDGLGRWFQWVSRPLLLSIRNTFRRKGRLALTLFTLTMAGAIFIAVFNVRASLELFLDQIGQHFMADITLTFEQPYRERQIEQVARQLPGISHVEGWLAASGEIMDENGEVEEKLQIIAPPSGSELIEPDMVAGRWLEPGDERAIALADTILDDFPDLKPGDKIRMRVQDGRTEEWTVVGLFRFIGMLGVTLGYVNYDTMADILNLSDESFSYRLVADAQTMEEQQALGNELDQLLRNQGFKVSEVEAGLVTREENSQGMNILVTFLLIMALLTAIVGSIGLTGTMGMNVLERTREIGVMRAIGAVDLEIMKSVVVEGVMIGLISWIFAVFLSFPISLLLLRIIGEAMVNAALPTAFTWVGAVIWLGVVLALSVVASLMPARNASRLTIREVLAYE
ncbi:MAG TPA: FtsX-like permease family protein [Anaerolineae bacterium]|nr:FtsX-like permease family protein [Anaerolineae bacterium]